MLSRASRVARRAAPQTRRGMAHRSREKPRLRLLMVEDVEGVGVKGEAVTVRHGFGRNFLLNERKAVYLTEANLARMDINVEEQTRRQEEIARMRDQDRTRRMLSSIRISMTRRARRKGNVVGLHVPVTAEVLCAHLDRDSNLDVLPAQVDLAEPISSFGTFKVPVSMGGVSSEVTVEVLEAPEGSSRHHGRAPWRSLAAEEGMQ